MATSPMMSPKLAAHAGVIPIRDMPVRFAVGAPDGITSNSWKIWPTKSGVYIQCRDNFQEAKVSLHTSTDPHIPGRWRMGISEEFWPKISHLRSHDDNRAWEVWDEPSPSLPGTVVAFKLIFPTSELAVKPEHRRSRKWRDVIYIESAPPGKLTVLTLFITSGEPELAHESEPSFLLASFDIGNGRRAQLIAHGDPESGFPEMIKSTVAQAAAQARSKGIVLPDQGYYYFLGRQPDGCRYVFGARVHHHHLKWQHRQRLSDLGTGMAGHIGFKVRQETGKE
jgi:hypothetical protein